MPSIRFRAPTLRKMANGQNCIELTEEGTWESFPRFAQALATQINAEIVERVDGPDVRLWIIRVADHDLSLVYDDFPNGVSLEPRDSSSSDLVEQLHASFLAEASGNGL
jgi:hypothetical protein